MSSETMPRLNPAWYESRRALQEHFAGFGVLPDASRLAYILGPQRSWTTEDVSRMWAEALATPVGGGIDTLNNVYIHVPFCKAICAFCNYERIKPSSPDLLEAWQKRV